MVGLSYCWYWESENDFAESLDAVESGGSVRWRRPGNAEVGPEASSWREEQEGSERRTLKENSGESEGVRGPYDEEDDEEGGDGARGERRLFP